MVRFALDLKLKESWKQRLHFPDTESDGNYG